MTKVIKHQKPADRVREDFIDFLDRAIPIYQKKMLTQSWPLVRQRAEEAREHASRLEAIGGTFLTVDKSAPIPPQLSAIAKAIAEMSFTPKGVTVLGRHWQSAHPGSTVPIEVERIEPLGALERPLSAAAGVPQSWESGAPPRPGAGSPGAMAAVRRSLMTLGSWLRGVWSRLVRRRKDNDPPVTGS